MGAIEVRLGRKDIDAVFARWSREKEDRERKWAKLFASYGFLLAHARHPGAPEIKDDYERTFNYFYQVRRNAGWRVRFYGIFARHARRSVRGARARADFPQILRELHEATGQVEMSFASKLAATIDPRLPVIDRHVLSYLGPGAAAYLRGASAAGPKKGVSARLARLRHIEDLHSEMRSAFRAYLRGSEGRYLVAKFRAAFPEARHISGMKMLDFVLWQSGGKKRGGGKRRGSAKKVR